MTTGRRRPCLRYCLCRGCGKAIFLAPGRKVLCCRQCRLDRVRLTPQYAECAAKLPEAEMDARIARMSALAAARLPLTGAR